MRILLSRSIPTLVLLLFPLSPVGAGDRSAEGDGSVMVTPADFEWVTMPTLPEGAEIALIEGSRETLFEKAEPFTFRLKLPADFEIPAHHHPWIEHATVIRGTLHMGYGDEVDRSDTKRLPPGSVAVLQPGSRHFSWTEEETVVQIHGVGPLVIHYADPDKDPRKK